MRYVAAGPLLGHRRGAGVLAVGGGGRTTVVRDLVVGSFTPSVLLAVARHSGRLAVHDLEVEEVPVPSSPAQFRSLLRGELDIALTSPDNVLAYRFDPENPLGRLADVRIVSTVDRGMGLGLYARPGLPDGAPLGECTFAVDVPTSGFALAMYALAERLGVGREELRLEVLGSTPNRLRALQAGDCDLTMLNAGNELLAEAAGCTLLAPVTEVSRRYVGTVVAVAGVEHLDDAWALAIALHDTAQSIREGERETLAITVEVAADRLGLPDDLAHRYLDRLRSPDEGLVTGPLVDREGVTAVAELRRRYLPRVIDGVDILAHALDDDSGLIAPGTPLS